MAYAKITLADLKQSLADRHDSGVLPTSSAILNFWTRLFNRGIAYCADRLRLTTSTSLTTSSGTIALPTDFMMIDSVIDQYDNPLVQVSKDDIPNQVGYTFWITGDHTNGFYLNTPSDETYTVTYVFKTSPLSSDSDICIIPDPEAVVAYAYGMLRKSETDPIEDADKSLAECDSRLKELQSSNSINDNVTGFDWV